MVELNEDGLGPLETDPATLAALHEANTLEGREVFDVNGLRLGRVTRAFAEEGALTRVDVSLLDNVREMLITEEGSAAVPPHWIAHVGDDGVRLRKAAEEIVHPEDPRPPGSSAKKAGAKGLPRKIR